MQKKRVTTFSELHEALKPYRDSLSWVFRGQRRMDDDWRLRPKAGRHSLKISDIKFFRAWKRHAVAYVPDARMSDWDWLAIAQHHGLATRLLDWTLNPLAAAFFAIESAEDDDEPSIIAYFDPRAVDVGLGEIKKDFNHPFDKGLKGKIMKVLPRSLTQRLVAQEGVFTVHDPQDLCLEDFVTDKDERRLEIITIAKDYVPELKMDLSRYGINRKSLFPDLDGLSTFLNWWYHPDTPSAITRPNTNRQMREGIK